MVDRSQVGDPVGQHGRSPREPITGGASGPCLSASLSVTPFRSLSASFRRLPRKPDSVFILTSMPLQSHRRRRTPKASATQSAVNPQTHPDAAGIDVGAEELVVAVPAGRDAGPTVRTFASFTADLQQLVGWLQRCGIQSVAMESTGNYWVPAFEALEGAGIEVCLVNARHVKGVPGRKSDVCDAQWLQQLHAAGLLRKSFRPPAAVAALRYVVRHRLEWIQGAARHLQHQQKVLTEMNLKLHHVFSDLDGESALNIVQAILSGEREPAKLAALRDPRCRTPQATIEKALVGHYRPELLFVLRQCHEAWQQTHARIAEADAEIARLSALIGGPSPGPLPKAQRPAQRRRHKHSVNMPIFAEAYRFFGMDLSLIDGVGSGVLLALMSEVGTAQQLQSCFRSAEAFASWLGLCPDNRISGGRVLKAKTRPVKSRLATALRLGAHGLGHAHNKLGEYCRRMKGRLGKAEGITATAHKLARIIYGVIAHQKPYDETVAFRLTAASRQNRLKRLHNEAAAIGMQLVPV
jgi:transposase